MTFTAAHRRAWRRVDCVQVYHEKVQTTSVFLRDTTPVTPVRFPPLYIHPGLYSHPGTYRYTMCHKGDAADGAAAAAQYTLLLFGGHIHVEHNSGGVTIDKWIQFAANGA